MTGFIVGGVIVAILIVGGLVYLNLRKPEVIDKAEQQVRDLGK